MWQSVPLGIYFSIRRKKETRIVFFAGVAAQEVVAIVQEQMPIAVVGKFGIRGFPWMRSARYAWSGGSPAAAPVAMPRSTNVSAINRSMLIHALARRAPHYRPVTVSINCFNLEK